MELAVKVIGIILSAITGAVAVIQWSTMRRRTKLKADLEILKMYKDAGCDEASCNRLRNAITQKVERAYGTSLTPRRDLDKSDLAIGSLSLLIAASIAVSILYSDEIGKIALDWKWGGIFAAVVFFCAGIIGVYKGVERKLKWWFSRSKDAHGETA